MPTLTVLVDGVPMPDAQARAFWERFSAYMEAHKGDLAGFAKTEGFASVRPALGANGPQLVVSRTQAQGPYAKAKGADGVGGREGSKAGSSKPQAGAPNHTKNRQTRR